MVKGGQRTLTMAPETGSRRLGIALNKYIEKDVVINAAQEAVRAGIKTIKLYLIAAIPGETREDLEETVNLIDKVLSVSRSGGVRLRVSVNPLIPKPHTPLQWIGFDRELAEESVTTIRKRLRKLGVEVDVYGVRYAMLQSILGLGDERLSRVIVEWGRTGGSLGSLLKISKRLGIDATSYALPKDPSLEPPWHRYVLNPFATLESLRKELSQFLKAVGLGG